MSLQKDCHLSFAENKGQPTPKRFDQDTLVHSCPESKFPEEDLIFGVSDESFGWIGRQFGSR
jgi:hypothetical protein